MKKVIVVGLIAVFGAVGQAQAWGNRGKGLVTGFAAGGCPATDAGKLFGLRLRRWSNASSLLRFRSSLYSTSLRSATATAACSLCGSI